MTIQIMIDVPDKQIVQLNHDLIGKSRVDSFGMAAGRAQLSQQHDQLIIEQLRRLQHDQAILAVEGAIQIGQFLFYQLANQTTADLADQQGFGSKLPITIGFFSHMRKMMQFMHAMIRF